jgi:hypothetical protein
MIQVADNFNYRGKKPNFDRDSFDTSLNKPIWKNSDTENVWIDATGATV